jgi:DNA polymerase-3 subunit beta
MKLTVSKKALEAGIKAVLPAVPTRPGLPILTGVRLETGHGSLVLETTDMETAIRRPLSDGVSMDRPGSVVVPAKALAKTVAAMPTGDVGLESTSEHRRVRLRVSAGTRKVTLDGWAPDDWPGIPEHSEMDPLVSAEASLLADALDRAALCASKDDTRPILTGVALRVTEDEALEVVATDSYRLGVVRVSVVSSGISADGPPLIPAPVAKALAKQLKAIRGTAEIRVLSPGEQSKLVAAISFEGTTWTVRTIEGEFPNWRQVMPEPDGALFEFDPEELVSALRAATSVWGTKAAPPIRLTLDRACTLVATDPNLGTMRETLDGASFSPNGVGAIQVAFNPGYLADAVRFCGKEQGRMWVRDALKPVRFDGPDRTYALMPIRIP